MGGLQFLRLIFLNVTTNNQTENHKENKMKETIHNKRPQLARVTLLAILLLVWSIPPNTTLLRLHNDTTHGNGGGGVRVFPVAHAFFFMPLPTRTRSSDCPSTCTTTSDHCVRNAALTRCDGGIRNGSVPRPIYTQTTADSLATASTWTTLTIPPETIDTGEYPPAGVTLSQYMMELAHSHPHQWGEMERIITSLQVACKTLSHVIRTSSLTGLNQKLFQPQGESSGINVHGEEQKPLDVIANTIMKQALQWTGKVSTIVSEEEDDPVDLGGTHPSDARIRPDILPKGPAGDDTSFVVSSEEEDTTILVERTGRYTAVFDPLDGSSNLEAGIPVGTIFGIFENDPCDDNLGNFWDGDYDGEDENLDDDDPDPCLLHNTHQPGRHLVAAGYCLYSSATTMVVTLGMGVMGFTYDEQRGEFILTHPHMKIPARGKVYSFNEANRWDWDLPLQKYITDIQQGRVRTPALRTKLTHPCVIQHKPRGGPTRYSNILLTYNFLSLSSC
jgi:fructose-1,6-bisphosphatase